MAVLCIFIMQEKVSASPVNNSRLTLPNEERIVNDEFERYQFRAKQLRTWWQVRRPKYRLDWSFYYKKGH
ncbi:hypothetical protein H5R92_07190 [Limosilactobacillus sp. BG-MG3-A]|uniref:Uncharacterized protein n=1 Tax=Limosilactobacillus agrestis TaxID=2759748 RepID=A0A7W3UHW9_9LACO|nr:hypothetical protein [Limosilactobacillus agrestis]MBD5091678.1 hypothetical protein [Lactobacillus sp.]